jgi:hypothetical protein
MTSSDGNARKMCIPILSKLKNGIFMKKFKVYCFSFTSIAHM